MGVRIRPDFLAASEVEAEAFFISKSSGANESSVSEGIPSSVSDVPGKAKLKLKITLRSLLQ